MRSFFGRRLALVRVELLLDHSLRPGLLAGRLVLGLELHLQASQIPMTGTFFTRLMIRRLRLAMEHSLPHVVAQSEISPYPQASS